MGTDFYEVKAELPTAQAVVPGQGQSVNIAGVKIGEVGDVKLENGRAVVTMQIQDKYKPIYHDATVLLRPKTGLKDMFLALDPGTKQAGALPEGGRVTVPNTLPDVNARRGARPARRATRAPTSRSCSAPAGPPSTTTRPAPTSASSRPPSRTCARSFKRFEPTAPRTARKITEPADRAPPQHQARDPQLPAALDRAGPSATTSSPASSTPPTRTSRPSPTRSRRCARRCSGSPARSSQTTTTLHEDRQARRRSSGPRSQRLRPFARELAPALRQTRRSCATRRRSSRRRSGPSRATCSPPCATCARRPTKLAPVTPRLTRSFKVLNKFFNTLAYDPPGATQPYLFWSAWAPTTARRCGRTRTRTGRCAAASCWSPAPATAALERGRAPAARSSACHCSC